MRLSGVVAAKDTPAVSLHGRQRRLTMPSMRRRVSSNNGSRSGSEVLSTPTFQLTHTERRVGGDFETRPASKLSPKAVAETVEPLISPGR